MAQGFSIVGRRPLADSTPPPGLAIVARRPYTAPDADPVRPPVGDPARPALPDVRVADPPRPKPQGLATIGEQLISKTLGKATGLSAAPPEPHPHTKTTRMLQSAASGLLRIPGGVWGMLRGTAENLGLKSIAEYATAQEQEVERVRASIAPDLRRAGTIEQGIASGFESIGSNLPAMAAGVVVGGPVGAAVALGTMGLTTAGNAYTVARKAGKSPEESARYAAIDGIVEVATEKIPMSRLLGDVAKNTGLMSLLTRQLAAEIPGEQVATLLQDANAWAHLNPEKTLAEFKAERKDAAAQTLVATIVGTLGQSGGAIAAQSLQSEAPPQVDAPPAEPVPMVPPTLPSAMPKAENFKIVARRPATEESAPVLPAEFAPVDAPVAQPVTAQPAVDPDAQLDVMSDPVQAAQVMRAENPQIDEQAKAMAERAREARAVFPDPMADVEDAPVTEQVTVATPEPASTVPAPVAERMKAKPKKKPSGVQVGKTKATVKDGEIDVEITPSDIDGVYDVVAYRDGEQVGWLAIGKNRYDEKEWSANSLNVNPENRRQGIASALYDAAYRAGIRPIVPDTKISDEAQAMWSRRRTALGKKGGEWKPVDKKAPSGPPALERRADYNGNVDESPRVKSGEIDRKHAFLMQWLADDMRQMPFEAESRMRGETAIDVTTEAESQEEARRAVYKPRVAGTPTQEMFAKLGMTGSRAEIASQIENFLSGRTKGGKAVAIARKLAPIFEAAYDIQTKRFDFRKVPDTLYEQAGLTYEDMRAPASGPSNPEHELAKAFYAPTAKRRAEKSAEFFKLASARRTERQIDFDPIALEAEALAGVDLPTDDTPGTRSEDSPVPYTITARRQVEAAGEDPRTTDVNEFGEQQDRLPGAESVRDTEVSTPEFDVPFSLTSEVGDSGSVQSGLFDSAATQVSEQETPSLTWQQARDRAKIPTRTEDWGSQRGQGKRSGGQVKGSMADPPKGRRTYKDYRNAEGVTEDVWNELRLLQDEDKQAVIGAIQSGMSVDAAFRLAYEDQKAPSGTASVGSVGTTTDNPVKPGTLPKGFTSVEQPGLLPVEEQALTFDATRPIEFPELLDLARELSETPSVVKKFRGEGRQGEFQSMEGLGTGTIRLHGDLFKRTGPFTSDTPIGARIFDPIAKEWTTLVARTEDGVVLRREDGSEYPFEGMHVGKLRADVSAENMRQLAATLAHEIGHLVDWLPSKTLKRGNILGRLRSLRKFLKETYTAADGSTIRQKEIRAELQALSDAWRPWDKASASPSFRAYRQSSKELYADALSVLLNSPGLLQEKAPKFYEQFFAELDRKPEVKQAYFALQELLSGTREELVERRRAGVRGMFEGADAKAIDIEKLKQAEAQAARKDLWLRLRIQHVDKNTPVIDRVKTLEKRGVRIPADEDPRYFLEERNYIGGKQKAFVEKHFQPVYRALSEAGIDWHTFGEALFYERIIAGDRSEMANPRGLTVEATKELYATLQGELTEDQMRVLGASVVKFRAAVKQVAEDAFQAGLYRPELYDQMKENPAYAAFRVVDYLEKDVTSKVHHQIGTLKDIQNPADATILKTLVTLRATEYQRMKVATFRFLHQHFPSDIQQAKQVWNGKGIVPVEPEDPKKQVLVYYYEQGKLRGKYVDPYIADALNNESVGNNWGVVQALRWINSAWFRPVFTSLNLGFQTFNLGRDFLRYWKNTPGMTFQRAIQRYYEAIPLARARAFGLPDNPSAKLQQAYRDMVEAEEARILSTTFNDLIDRREIGDTQIEDIFAKTGVTLLESPPKNPTARALVSVLNWIKRSGDFVETLPKAAGIYEFTGDGAIKDIPADQRSFIRRKIGSPDFLAGGTYKPVSNELLLFSNAITQAIRADLEVAREPQTRAGFWWKTAALNVAPKLALFAAIYGFADEDDDWLSVLRGITEYDLTNYLPIPLGTDDKGNTVYLRMPQDDFGRLIGGLTWKTLQLFRGDRDLLTSAMQVFDYTAGQVPGVTPILSLAKDAATFAAGGNVYDDFRNRFLFTDDELAARDSRTITKFLAYEFQQLGGGIFWKFSAGPSVPRDTSTTQEVLELPVVSNIIGRWIRVTNFGELERLRAATSEVGKAEARRRLTEREAVSDAIRAYQQLIPPQRTPAKMEALAREVTTRLYRDLPAPERQKEYRDILKKIRMGAARGSADPYVDALIGARSNDQRVAVVTQAAASMGDAAFQQWLQRARREQLISDAVASAAQRQLRQRMTTR